MNIMIKGFAYIAAAFNTVTMLIKHKFNLDGALEESERILKKLRLNNPDKKSDPVGSKRIHKPKQTLKIS